MSDVSNEETSHILWILCHTDKSSFYIWLHLKLIEVIAVRFFSICTWDITWIIESSKQTIHSLAFWVTSALQRSCHARARQGWGGTISTAEARHGNYCFQCQLVKKNNPYISWIQHESNMMDHDVRWKPVGFWDSDGLEIFGAYSLANCFQAGMMPKVP